MKYLFRTVAIASLFLLFGVMVINFDKPAYAQGGCYIPDQYRSSSTGKCQPGYIKKKSHTGMYTCVRPCTRGRFYQTFGEQRNWASCGGQKVRANMYTCRWKY
ncbi:MAG TPA: hypothetical protein PK293_06745 [Spirochaetota bacterium]|nr:hypothetical protein [Spirochaetota bacterium]HPF05717.1 hypothetical protein [Spirochaetota bacterium]HPJ42798.1 hypothetical protein [Spirochaetota bacterium]